VRRDREEDKILFTRRRNYNRSMGCQGGHKSNEGHGYRLSCSEDEKNFQ